MSLVGVIDGLQFARDGGELRGTLGLEQLPRLAESPCKTFGVGYCLRGGLNRAGKPSLAITASGRIELVCQRCLGSLLIDVDLDVELELCADPDAIAQADDEVDRVLATREMSVAQMVEDEVILALPQVPKHENCKVESLIAQPKEQSLFSVLAGLKKRGDR